MMETELLGVVWCVVVNLFFISVIVLWNLKIGWFLRGKAIKS